MWGNMSAENTYPKSKHRIYSGLMRYAEKVILKAETGFRFALAFYTESETYDSQTGWKTDYTLPENTNFRILIARQQSDESTSEFANMREFMDAITLSNYSENDIFALIDSPYYYNGKMRIAAHMGLQNGYVEPDCVDNSNLAYENAGKHKLYMCESDVQETSDGAFIMMHDSTVDRTTNGTGTVSQMTLTQIRELYLLRYNGEVSNQRVPTFEEYLVICKTYGMIALCEIKSLLQIQNIQNLDAIIKKYGMEKQLWYIASNPANASLMRTFTDIPIVALTNPSDSSAVQTLKLLNNVCAGIDYNAITAQVVEDMHNSGIPVDAYTVNSKATADTLLSYGVDIITSDALTETDWM
jgi:glycerophosphoryl diester phosphodiesterase